MTEKKIIDCIGLNCPQPVLMTRDALNDIDTGIIEVIVDNEASRDNVSRFGKSQGCEVVIVEENDTYHLSLTKTSSSAPLTDSQAAEEYLCRPDEGLVYMIGSNTMGEGDEELGLVLMRAFIKTIKEVNPQPVKMFFYNSGVFLTAKESDLLGSLKLLENQGVEIYSCGTCLDYYHLKDTLFVGQPTNMFEIMSAMASAAKVMSPW